MPNIDIKRRNSSNGWDILKPTPASHVHVQSEISGLTTALNSKLNTSLKGAANGLAELDASGKVPNSQLPAYVDDVLVYGSLLSLPGTGEDDKIYITEDSNKTYRWNGSGYTEISPSLALGTTAQTAFRGDQGWTAYAHTSLTNNPHSVSAAQIGLGNVDNTSDADKPISTATQTALNGKLSLTGGTITGPLTMSGSGDPIYVNRIGGRGTEIYIGAGESLSHISGTSERVYIAGESGVQIFASSDNLSSGLNRTATLLDTAGNATWGSGTITAGLFNGNASSATKLATARTIGGVSFDGTANINLPGVNTTGNQDTTGNAATATKFDTSKNINGTAFDGSASITTSYWGSTRNITIGNETKSVNGSGNYNWTLSEIGALSTSGKAADSEKLDGVDGTGYARNFGTKTNTATTTAAFITLLDSWGMFNYTHSIAKFSWSYAGNADLTDTGYGTIETAGAVVETFTDGSTKTVRLICPNTGGGAYQDLIYNDQGSTYSPGWRKVLNDKTFTAGTHYAAASHTHGDISNTGSITASAGIASGDHIIIADHSDSNRLKTSSITFGTGTTTFLRNDGTWATPSDIDTNNYVTGISGSGNGTVTLTRSGLSNLSIDLSHTHDYISEGGTSFSGTYPVAVRVGANNFYSDADITFTGSTSTLTVTGDVVVGGQSVVKTNDSRLSDARTPTSHTHPYSDLTGTVPTWNQDTTGRAANADSADWADQVDVNSSSSTGTFNVVWHSGDTLYNATGAKLTVQPSTGNLTSAGTVTATGFVGNASTATKLATARSISLTGDVTGSTSFDGSGNVSISATGVDSDKVDGYHIWYGSQGTYNGLSKQSGTLYFVTA